MRTAERAYALEAEHDALRGTISSALTQQRAFELEAASAELERSRVAAETQSDSQCSGDNSHLYQKLAAEAERTAHATIVADSYKVFPSHA